MCNLKGLLKFECSTIQAQQKMMQSQISYKIFGTRRGNIGAQRGNIGAVSGDCGVGITPQMCNRVTNHRDMGIFFQTCCTVTDGPFAVQICQRCTLDPKKKNPYWCIMKTQCFREGDNI